jgi:predicted nucleotidyltransferase
VKVGIVSFKERVREKIAADPELSKIYSLVLFGSYVRGDFVPGLSDLDFFVVVRNELPDMDRLKEIIEGCAEGIKYKLIDLPWERLEDLRDPMRLGYGFKFLTIYQRDFLEHHEVVYGEEVAHLIPLYPMDELIRWRTERLANSGKLIEENPDLAPVVAGEVCRLIAVINGAKGISKQTILETLEKVGDEQALEIYKAYVENRQLSMDREYYLGFIASRIKHVKSD